MGFVQELDEYWVSPPWGSGQAAYVSGETESDNVVDALRKTVEEVTRKPVAPTVKPRIGFLP